MAWVAIIVALVMAVVGELLRPKPKLNNPKPSAIGDFSFPTADASRVIPVYFGTCKMEGPNCVWFGDLTVVTLTKKVKTGWFSSKKMVTGYNYYLGVQLVFAYGPTDAFLELRVDDHVVTLRNGPAVPTRVNDQITAYIPAAVSAKEFVGDVCSFYIDAPNVLDNGDPPSGVKGNCKLYRGTSLQPPNMYLSEQWGEEEMSAFRPLMHLVMEKCYLGNSDTPPTISIVARRCPNQLGLTGGRHNVNGDSNIACAVFEVMTDMMWGMKIPQDRLDRSSFIEAGNTLADEGIGISMLIQTGMLGKDLVAEMLRHADGVIYADPVTGLFTLKLARADYVEEDLITVDNRSIVPDTFEFSRTTWEMTKNTIIVNYTDRQTFDTKPVQYQDLANIDVRNGAIDSETFDFRGFSNAVAAMETAARVSKIKGSPLVSAKMSLNRVGFMLRPGSVFRLQKPDRGLANIIMRVIEISYGTLDDPAIKITAMEDIFAVNAVAYLPPAPSEWTPPVAALAPFAQQRLVEAPAFGADDTSRRFVITLAVPASPSTMGYDVWSDPAGGVLYTQTNSIDSTTPSGVLVGDYLRTGPEVDAAGFTVSNVVGAALLAAGGSGAREGGENLLLIGDELLAWENLVANPGGTYAVTGVYRAVLDTQPQDHAAGARVFFLSEGAGTTNEDGYAGDVSLRAKLLPKSVNDTLPIDSAVAMTMTTAARALRPLPPGRFRINGAAVGPGASASGTVTVTWAHRNRFDEDVVPQTAASRAPEEGTTYNVRLYNHGLGSLLAQVEGASGAATSATIRGALDMTMRVEVEAVREGRKSWTALSRVFAYTAAGSTGNAIVVDEPEYVLDGGGA